MTAERGSREISMLERKPSDGTRLAGIGSEEDGTVEKASL